MTDWIDYERRRMLEEAEMRAECAEPIRAAPLHEIPDNPLARAARRRETRPLYTIGIGVLMGLLLGAALFSHYIFGG